LIVLALLKLTLYDAHVLAGGQLALAESLVAAIVLLGGYVSARIAATNARLAIYGLVPISAVLASKVIVDTTAGDTRGYLFGLLVAAYVALTAVSHVGRRDRNLISLLAIPSALFAAFALTILLQSWWLAAAFATVGATLFLLGRALGEPRFQLLGFTFLANVVALAMRFAHPDHLLRAVDHPAAGLGAVSAAVGLLVLAALTACGGSTGDELDTAYAQHLSRIKDVLRWTAAGLGLYGVSLVVLELWQHLGGDVHTGFQRGETAVSGLWALVGLAILWVGLFRRRRAARVGGLTLLLVALAKLFLFDLSNLSSLSRAVSFLVVGAALLGGGFVYQKLNAELGAGDRSLAL
jgi:uncharacterized membrane protein